MKKITLSGQMRAIPMECPESDLELRYNLDQCQDYIAVLEADNKMLRKALQDIVDNEVGTAYETAYQALKPNK